MALDPEKLKAIRDRRAAVSSGSAPPQPNGAETKANNEGADTSTPNWVLLAAEGLERHKALKAAIKEIEAKFEAKIDWRCVDESENGPFTGEWFYMDSNQSVHGPYSFSELRTLEPESSRDTDYWLWVWRGSPPSPDQIYTAYEIKSLMYGDGWWNDPLFHADLSEQHVARDLLKCARELRCSSRVKEAFEAIRIGPIESVARETKTFLRAVGMASSMVRMARALEPSIFKALSGYELDDDFLRRRLEELLRDPYTHGSDTSHAVALTALLRTYAQNPNTEVAELLAILDDE